MSLRRVAIPTIILVVCLTGCGTHTDIDQLSHARHTLHSAPCGSSPAVAGVARVNTDPHEVFVGDWIVVSVCHLDQLLKAADAAQAPVSLFLEGKDSFNEPMGIDLESGTLTFVIDRHEKNRELWRPFLYDPLFDHVVAMRVSVGISGERPLPRVPGAHMTVRVDKIYVDWTTWLWILFLGIFVVLVFAAAAYTDMLRIGPPVDGVKQPYSLGRTQMAWWFFLVVLSYSFIWLITSDRDTIPPSLLGLMGISSATALAAAVIRPAGSFRSTRGWWRDLVSDENGVVALDRLQVIVWTLVLSGIFLSMVVWELTMPEFSATMLTLMGISSGTYVGFKLPHKPGAPENP